MPTLEFSIQFLREEIQKLVDSMNLTLIESVKGHDFSVIGNKSEAIANSILALRHLEDAKMRLGKCLQHLGDGTSIYDK